jgi:glycosyltransferase XagB
VTEDADLGLRLARAGFAAKTLDSHTEEEAPLTFKALVDQRSRWMKGWMQTALAHCRDLPRLRRDLGLVRALAALALLAGGFAGPLLGPLLSLLYLERILLEDALAPRTPSEIALATLWCFVALAGLASIFGPMLVGMRRRGLARFWPALLLVPLWQAMLTLAAWRALRELWTNPYLWRKTEHGLTRRSRRPPRKERERPDGFFTQMSEYLRS